MKRWFSIVLGLVLGVCASYAVSWLTGSDAVAQLTPVDHYKCYKITPKQNVAVALTLVDQFETESVTKVQSRFICAPVSKNGSPVFNQDVHLKMYRVLGAKAIPKDQRPLINLTSGNPDLPNEQNVEVVRPLFLLVPNTKQRIR
jgi:hypothetical protein